MASTHASTESFQTYSRVVKDVDLNFLAEHAIFAFTFTYSHALCPRISAQR